ncbi:hypothetical protein C6988_02680 [Nitrosopumilus sp. b1]|uniref:hypothetical protein n=1 Tax=Nitrosopumilus sp. b1 TaxID=2109907 RepID=UPI0015F404E2|nr:hypothetical protein [Nitrosopumilus sp. b1]KAF6243560.1 hypothetical protein C6988_02680 [Nitrosopumilus sp. b1]
MDPLIQEAIRNPTSEQASSVMSDITPDILKDTMPSILHNLDSGVPSEELAENTVDGILTTVEKTVLGDAFDLMYDKFGERILDMVFNGAFLKIFEKVSLLFS